jgi:hypothetical protein
VKVHCGEGVAIHVAPDPCAGVREDVGEASVGERIGQPLSREIVINRERWRFLVIRDPKVKETVGGVLQAGMGRAGRSAVSSR